MGPVGLRSVYSTTTVTLAGLVAVSSASGSHSGRHASAVVVVHVARVHYNPAREAGTRVGACLPMTVPGTRMSSSPFTQAAVSPLHSAGATG